MKVFRIVGKPTIHSLQSHNTVEEDMQAIRKNTTTKPKY
jgi:hypothetical protein